ncbi:hypothetical protein K438DRAFT_1802229 [Mycena galopus ATCC 62051]|nr:hypothetical protein K438DRAFT_1802229 [Mycena galopus ATCC 62051]
MVFSIRPPLTKDVLQSSQRLSAAEIALATHFISIAEQELSDVERAIDRASPGVEWDELTHQREDIAQQILQHKNAIRCIRRLPPEIVSEFLALTLPYVEPNDFGETPWYLGHICQYWRDVALASANLWSDIVIVNVNEYPVEQLQTLLGRAENSPLKFRFWAPNAGRQNPRVRELLQIMVACSDRWRSASIFITPSDWTLLAPLRGRLSMLRSLRIDVSDFEGFYRSNATVSEDIVDPFELAPALRDATLEDLSGLPHPLVLPFQQLTRLQVITSYGAIGALLPTAPNLEMATLDFTNLSSDSEIPLLCLPHLRRLYLTSQLFLDHLELPALEEIYMLDTHPTSPFLSLVERCPTIRLTTLRLAWYTSTNISRILEACPTVETLGLQMISVNAAGSEVFSDLTVRRPSAMAYTGVGHSLQSISLAIDGALIVTELFVDMVESRWRVPAEGSPFRRLRSVELLITDGGTVDRTRWENRLAGLREEGLRVSVLDGSEARLELKNWRV